MAILTDKIHEAIDVALEKVRAPRQLVLSTGTIDNPIYPERGTFRVEICDFPDGQLFVRCPNPQTEAGKLWYPVMKGLRLTRDKGGLSCT